MLQVTCAIITDGEKILAVQRGRNTDHPYQWEFPGGKIKDGETAEACISREIEEELSVKISILKQLKPIDHDYGNKQIHLIPFVCLISEGEIQLTEHIAMQWVQAEELINVEWSEADRKIVWKNKLFRPSWETTKQ